MTLSNARDEEVTESRNEEQAEQLQLQLVFLSIYLPKNVDHSY